MFGNKKRFANDLKRDIESAVKEGRIKITFGSNEDGQEHNMCCQGEAKRECAKLAEETEKKFIRRCDVVTEFNTGVLLSRVASVAVPVYGTIPAEYVKYDNMAAGEEFIGGVRPVDMDGLIIDTLAGTAITASTMVYKSRELSDAGKHRVAVDCKKFVYFSKSNDPKCDFVDLSGDMVRFVTLKSDDERKKVTRKKRR